MNKSYIVELEGEEGDILPIPDELMEELGWKIGDSISFEMLPDGKSFSMKKVEDTDSSK
jgi:bifunctional DNA-binding transcriptional regulator/antitoxin component of YhaV-PrlF toxin-antitoxin module